MISRSNSHHMTDMSDGVIWRQLLCFSIPTATGLLFQHLYNIVDAIIVGQFVSKEALAAVGSTACISNMMIGLSSGLSTGAGVVAAQCYGQQDIVNLRKTVHVTLIMTIYLGIAATLLGVLSVGPMLKIMKTPSDIYEEAYVYLTIYFTGFSALFLYNMGAGILRALGDSRRPLFYLVISSLLHILLDLLFVVVFHLGVAGVACATVLTHILSAALILLPLSLDQAPYKICLKEMKMDVPVAKRILNVGVPSGLQQALNSFSTVYIQSAINQFGSSCIAGWSIHSKLDALLLIPQEAISLGCSAFAGQNYGAGKNRRIRSGVRWAICLSAVTTCILVVLMLLYSRPLVMLFNTEPEVVWYGTRIMSFIIPFYPVCCFNLMYASALRGTGHAKASSAIILFSYVVFRQGYLFLAQLCGNHFTAVILVYPLGWAVSCLLHGIYYHRPGFLKEDVPETKNRQAC